MELSTTYLVANNTLNHGLFAVEIVHLEECYVKIKHSLIWEILRATQ